MKEKYILSTYMNKKDTEKAMNLIMLTKDDKIKGAISDILWMAIRYADGRHTYAPSTVRRAVKVIKEVYPDFKLKEDKALIKPNEKDLFGASFKEDYLYDLVNQNKEDE